MTGFWEVRILFRFDPLHGDPYLKKHEKDLRNICADGNMSENERRIFPPDAKNIKYAEKEKSSGCQNEN